LALAIQPVTATVTACLSFVSRAGIDCEPLIGTTVYCLNGNYIHELSDAEYYACAQAEIILGSVDSVWQPSEKVIRLNGTEVNVPGDANVESAACDHGESSCRACGACGDWKVRIESVRRAKKALCEGREPAVE
jgi:hypothetical protein